MPNKLEQIQNIYLEMLQTYPDGLSSTSTKKFDDLKSFFADWLQLNINEIYATGAGTRPGNLEVRLSQGLQAIKHTKLGLAFLLDDLNIEANRIRLTNSTLSTIEKFIGRGKAHYDIILILIQSEQRLFVTDIAFISKSPIVDELISEFNLSGKLVSKDNNTSEAFEQPNMLPVERSTNDYSYIDTDVEPENIDTTMSVMTTPFNPALINIDTKTPSLDLLIKRISQPEPEIELNTESYFQRKDNLWDVGKQSRLIESILIRFPLPAFYFDGSNKNKWLVVDGLQRLSSIRNFIVKKSLKLSNLEFLVHLNGYGYDDLSRDLQRVIEETQIVIYIINPGTPLDVKFNIFKRINTGGLVLEAQEIRHALNQGEPARYVAELADLQEFIVATGGIKKERMLDRDFVNRFLCFYLFGYENYVPDLETFMSRAMAHINRMSEEEKLKCKSDFKSSMILNQSLFGVYAFRKYNPDDGKRNRINKALFDVFSVSFAKLSKTEIDLLIERKDEFLTSYYQLLWGDSEFFDAISASTSDKNRVTYRFNKIQRIIESILS